MYSAGFQRSTVHPLAVGRLSPQALSEMVHDGVFSSGTRGTFAQFAKAYVDAWTHPTRSGELRVSSLRPQVTVSTIQEPPELEAFIKMFPDTVYREKCTCTLAVQGCIFDDDAAVYSP